MKQPFKFIFGSNSWAEHTGLILGLVALIVNSYEILQAAFGIIAISIFIKLLINVVKYFTLLKMEKVFGRQEE